MRQPMLLCLLFDWSRVFSQPEQCTFILFINPAGHWLRSTLSNNYARRFKPIRNDCSQCTRGKKRHHKNKIDAVNKKSLEDLTLGPITKRFFSSRIFKPFVCNHVSIFRHNTTRGTKKDPEMHDIMVKPRIT